MGNEQSGEYDVIVSGAGPTGLMLSLWLVRKGVKVLTVDKAAGIAPESRALGVQARTMETYDMLGVGEQALRAGKVAKGVSFWRNAETRYSFEFADMGKGLSPHPYMFVLSQNENEAILYQALQNAGGEVQWNTELLSFHQDPNSVQATLQSSESSRQVTARYLCGCDGASSAVRRVMLGSFPGGTYKGHFFVADVTLSEAFEHINLNIQAQGILLLFPMKGERRARLLGDMSEKPKDSQSLVKLVEKRSQQFFHSAVEQTHWTSVYKVHHRVADSFQQGRVFLLGDAAHVHSPVGGQGMNTGLMDASNLGWKLAAVLRRGAKPEILDSYARERVPFAQRLVRTTDTFFQFVTSKSPFQRLFRTLAIPSFFSLAKRFRFIQRFMFQNISQIRIHYRSSPLSGSGDLVGKVQAGDRLPWLPCERSGDNFASLQSCDWQIHIYGDHTDYTDAWCKVPIHTFAYGKYAKKAGILENAVYLIRPDAYVGMVLQSFDVEQLNEYLNQFGL